MKTFIEHFYQKKEAQVVTSLVPYGEKAPENFPQGQILELVELYRAIHTKTEQLEVEKMKADFVSCWRRLGEEKQKMLVEKLLEEKLLPESIGKALKIFGGKLISLV